MKKRILAAALAVIMASGLFACTKTPEEKGTPSDATVETATETEISATTAPETTQVETTAEPTTLLSTTVTRLVTTTKKLTTTVKATTTKKPTTTRATTVKAPETTELELLDFRVSEDDYATELKYGVVCHRIVTKYYEKQPDGTEVLVKEEINSELVDRVLYHADYDDLLPAAQENREKFRSKINEVLSIINGYRVDGGLKPLKLNEKLTEIACVRAEEIAWSGDHDHTRPNLQSCFSLMRENGFSTGLAGENIGWGFSSSSSVCEAWKNSKTHYENIMNPDFTETGIGIAADPDKDGNLCWSQYFYGG